MTDAAHAWEALSAALLASAPACQDDPRFIADGRADGANAELARLCAGCPVLEECLAYALAAPRHLIVGYWAGARRGVRPRESVAA